MFEVTHRFGQLILSCVYFQSKLLGIVHPVFDSRKQQLIDSKWSRFYCIFMSLLTICGICLAYYNMYDNTPYLYGKYVLAIVSDINIVFSVSMTFGMICVHLCRQKLLTEPLNQIVALKNQMQKDVNSSFYTAQFIALTVFKFSAPFNQCLSMFISVLPILREGGAWVITCWLFLFLVVFAVAAIINLYYLGILCLWRVHEMNNQRLLTLVSKLKGYSDLRGTAKLRKVSMQRLCDASDTMDEIAETNSRIYFCGDHLRRALSFQTIAGFASTFVSCTIEIFCFYHFLWNITYLDPIYVFVTTWRILYEYLDIFLIANAANFGNHASDQTRYLLHSHLDSVQISDKRLMKSVSCIN